MSSQPDDVLDSIKNELILLDRAMVSTDDDYPLRYHLPLDDLAIFIAEQVRLARLDELRKQVKLFEWGKGTDSLDDRIAELQKPTKKVE